MYTLVCWNKLQKILKSLHCFAYVIRDRTDQLDNKNIATKEFIERNEQRRNYFGQFQM